MVEFAAQERKLREASATNTLDLLRVAIKRRAHGLGQKLSHKSARGQRANTRMEGRVGTMQVSVNRLADEYRATRAALLALGMPDDHPLFKELRMEDIGVGKLLWGKRSLGSGYAHLSWIWQVPMEGGTAEDWSTEGTITSYPFLSYD